MEKPFWEKSYQEDTLSTFGVEPNASVKEYLDYYNRNWNVLEVGCGEGKRGVFNG